MKSDDEIPSSISHYTTLEGLKGIVETRSLWASNASFLNDKAELSHALEVAKQAIFRLSVRSTKKQWAPMLKKVIAEFLDGGVPDTFVTCFSQSDDNLSQWRGYGGTVQGISLTFDRKQLSELLEPHNALFFKVIYSKLTTTQKLTAALAKEIDELAEQIEPKSMQNEEQLCDNLRGRVSALLPRFKHIGFRDEREWRYAIQRKVKPQDLNFRVSNNKIVPYIKIGDPNKLLPITKARVGPGPDPELTMRSVKLFLASRGYEIPVGISEVPFRP